MYEKLIYVSSDIIDPGAKNEPFSKLCQENWLCVWKIVIKILRTKLENFQKKSKTISSKISLQGFKFLITHKGKD